MVPGDVLQLRQAAGSRRHPVRRDFAARVHFGLARDSTFTNFKAQRDGVLDSGFLRSYATAELHASGPVHNAIFHLLLPREQIHVGADTGIGLLIRIERAADIRGKPVP